MYMVVLFVRVGLTSAHARVLICKGVGIFA